jgi:hypothetical protein
MYYLHVALLLPKSYVRWPNDKWVSIWAPHDKRWSGELSKTHLVEWQIFLASSLLLCYIIMAADKKKEMDSLEQCITRARASLRDVIPLADSPPPIQRRAGQHTKTLTITVAGLPGHHFPICICVLPPRNCLWRPSMKLDNQTRFAYVGKLHFSYGQQCYSSRLIRKITSL